MKPKTLVEKWAPVLDYDKFEAITGDHRRDCVAQMLETVNMERGRELARRGDNTIVERFGELMTEDSPTNVFGASSSTAGTGPIDIYDPILIGLVRRTMPKLIAYDVCGVQPMKGPSGSIFALKGRERGQSRARPELFYGEANTSVSATAAGNTAHQSANSQWVAHVGTNPGVIPSSGTYTTTPGFNTLFSELLGSDDGNEINEVGMTIDRVGVEVKSRKLKASFSHEMAQDLMAIHGLSAETELANFITNELLFDINREIIRNLYETATIGAQGKQSNGIFNMNVDSDGRWIGEKVKGLVLQIDFEANDISKATRFGKGNFLVTSSNVASALNMSGDLDYSPEMKQKLAVDDTGNTFVGTMKDGKKVFIDPYHVTTTNVQFVMVGYRGSSSWDAGFFYCPYVPLMFMKATDPKSLQPVIGFNTRYGKVANPFATSAGNGVVSSANKNRYYRLFAVTNLL